MSLESCLIMLQDTIFKPVLSKRQKETNMQRTPVCIHISIAQFTDTRTIWHRPVVNDGTIPSFISADTLRVTVFFLNLCVCSALRPLNMKDTTLETCLQIRELLRTAHVLLTKHNVKYGVISLTKPSPLKP